MGPAARPTLRRCAVLIGRAASLVHLGAGGKVGLVGLVGGVPAHVHSTVEPALLACLFCSALCCAARQRQGRKRGHDGSVCVTLLP